MIEYQIASHLEFSALKNPMGNFYHQMGNYELLYDGCLYIPINRSYVPIHDGDRRNGVDPHSYKKSVLIHEKTPDTANLIQDEKLIDLYRKPLLFLNQGEIEAWYPPTDLEDPRLSPHVTQTIDMIREGLLRLGFDGDYQIGVYGSHRVGLHGVDSDMDLVGWTDAESRELFTNQVLEVLRQNKFQSTKDSGRDEEYAARYAQRFQISRNGGRYLAERRNRLVSPDGIPASWQCLTNETDHQTVKGFWEGIGSEWRTEEVDLHCRVGSTKMAYNYPKVWSLQVDGQDIKALSFSWMHQGMADDHHQYGDIYRFKGAKVENESGTYLYLRDNTHYLLPQSLT